MIETHVAIPPCVSHSWNEKNHYRPLPPGSARPRPRRRRPQEPRDFPQSQVQPAQRVRYGAPPLRTFPRHSGATPRGPARRHPRHARGNPWRPRRLRRYPSPWRRNAILRRRSGQSQLSASSSLEMGRHDWYRNETWTPEVQAAFRERFDRSRGSFHKAQYLRIQAFYLAKAREHRAALELLNELLEKHPD